MDTYIITGASSDIGIAFLKKMEMNGEKILSICQYNTNSNELKDLKSRFTNVNIELFQCNLKNSESIRTWITEMKEKEISPTHILHLAACRFDYMRLKQFDWDKTVDELSVQVNTIAQLFKEYLPQMAKRKYGKIAVMLTAYTIGVPPKFMSDYIISKYALLGLMRSAASEYAGKGITINGLSPNMIQTKFLSNLDSRMVEMNAKESAMQRNVYINEIVDSLNYLLSDASNYMNGVNLNLSGGDRM
jgi:Dehydrogenases with different specificities (related to short-chain alcohol dehydrogenases)